MARSIAELIGLQLAQTETDILADTNMKWVDTKSSAIERAKVDLYYGLTQPDESAMPEIVKFYLADCGCVTLIDVATDWYKSQSRLSDSKEGATIQWYDRIDALERLRDRLLARIAKNKERIEIIAGGGDMGGYANIPLAQAQDDERGKVTIDPYIVGRYSYGDYIAYDEAVPFGLTPEREGL